VKHRAVSARYMYMYTTEHSICIFTQKTNLPFYVYKYLLILLSISRFITRARILLCLQFVLHTPTSSIFERLRYYSIIVHAIEIFGNFLCIVSFHKFHSRKCDKISSNHSRNFDEESIGFFYLLGVDRIIVN